MMSKMMKIRLNKSIRDETGQAFILVLILLVVGGLIMAPLLGFMGTGLIVGQAYEQRMAELYAADAGIEDAILKIQNDLAPIEYSLTVNGKDVWVQIPPEGDADPMITFFANIGVLEGTQGDYNKNKPQAEWLMVYNPIQSSTSPDTYDSYRITGFYSSTQKRDILTAGFWIHLYTGDTEVIPWNAALDNNREIDLDGDGVLGEVDINGVIIDENNIITRPLVQGYDPVTYRTAEEPLGSEAFIWEWANNQGPVFGQKAEGNEDVFCRTQRFTLDPPIVVGDGKAFPINVAFLETKQNSIQISWSGETITGIEGVRAIATDLATGKSTTVLSYVFAEQTTPGGPVAITILTWEADLQ